MTLSLVSRRKEVKDLALSVSFHYKENRIYQNNKNSFAMYVLFPTNCELNKKKPKKNPNIILSKNTFLKINPMWDKGYDGFKVSLKGIPVRISVGTIP